VARLLTRFSNASLQTKFAVQTGLLTVAIFAILLPLVLDIQRNVLLSEVEDAGFRVTEMFARTSVQGIVADDYLIMQYAVNGIASDRKVVAAMLLGDDGAVLAHSRVNERGKRYTDDRALAAARTRTPLLQRWVADGVPVFDFAVPVYVLADKRASARVVLSVERELAGIARTRTSILLLGALVLGAGLLWAAFQSRRLTRPLRALVRGTQEISRGNLAHRFEVKAGDELGRLADAFNSMTASLQQLVDDLQRSHRELSAAQENLVAKTRMAAMGEIAAVVAHETRNPLGALSNCIQLLQKNPGLTGDEAELLAIMRAESQRLNDIVSEFLAFGRPRPPHFQEVALGDVIDEMLTLLRRDDRCPPTARLARHLDPAVDTVYADPDQLRQVLWNLLLNAVEAGRERPALTVETHRRGAGAEIVVRDSGPGLAPHLIPRVFEPFFTTKAGGTGLGLAIVRRIVEDHGGRVDVESRPQVGTAFTIVLPLLPRPAPSAVSAVE
jgi:signal transduction histidine kinase